MKIGLMHNLYGQYSRGGAETAVKLVADDFRKSGHQVFIVSTRPKNAKEDKPDKTEKVYYIDSEFRNLGQHSKAYRALWHIGDLFSIGKGWKIRRILENEKPDLVMTHNLTGLGFMVPPILRNLKIRHEHFLHDIQLLHPSGLMIFGHEKEIDSPAAKAYQALARTLFASPAKVISPSQWLMEIHKQHGFFKDSQQEIRPFVWPGTKESARAKKPARRFLFIGQIEDQKGIFLLISAFKKISDQNISLTIAVRGGGSGLGRAHEESKQDARIHVTEPLSYEETDKLKAESDCLIVPSLCYENSPTVIHGAHAAGLPVIASRIGGIPELMEKDDILFAPGDEDDLIDKIMTMTKESR